MNIIKKKSKVRITIRLNFEEIQLFNSLLESYSVRSRSGFIKQLLFQEIKPYMDNRERELLGALIVELNAIGRNLNQLLRYKAFDDGILLTNKIKGVVDEIQKAL
ncbi:hypothetical protein ABSA28_00185 [Candidatus Hepatincolaceae symbiont of Richtersius coronifer]